MSGEAKVCASGDMWVGAGTGSVESAILEVLRGATNRLYLASYSLTEGASPLWLELEAALSRGVAVDFVLNRPETQPFEPLKRLAELGSIYPHLRVWGFRGPKGTDLHAKVVGCDDRMAVLGSSNLSFRGLVTNHELGVLVTGEAAGTLCAKIRELIGHRDVGRFP